ncbi:MAG: Hsp20/alpha crystallin family protein [Methanosarcinales archaeon]
MVDEEEELDEKKKESGKLEVLSEGRGSVFGLKSPYELWSEVDRLFEDFMATFDEVFWSPFSTRRRQTFSPWKTGAVAYREPFVDVVDTGSELKLRVELPGVPKENIEIAVTGSEVELSARVAREEKEEREGYLYQERGSAEFYRKLTLPEDILPEKADAKLEHGVLEITLPKKEPRIESKKYRINVR